MTVEIAVRVSGLLFLSILATLAASVALGNMVEVGDSELDNRLDKINKDPKKFQLSIVFGHIEGVRIIAPMIMLIIAFSSYCGYHLFYCTSIFSCSGLPRPQ